MKHHSLNCVFFEFKEYQNKIQKMKTEIIKISAYKENITEFLRKIGSKIGLRDNKCEVTVILKDANNTQRSISSKLDIEDTVKSQDNRRKSQVYIQRSSKFLLPNLTISDNIDQPQNDKKQKEGGSSKSPRKKEKRISIMNNLTQNQIQEIKKIPQVSVGIQTKQEKQQSFSQEIDIEANNRQYIEQQQFDQDEDNESQAQSVFIIENKINDAIKFIEKDELNKLQDYLYDFKNKYSVLNDRVQIKWRLLMAHCKQNRKEYERAAINYNQVVEIAQQSPKSLPIDISDVFHRLGICYSEIKEYNLGIMAFVKALNIYKQKKKYEKYSQCMNNLGTLLLSANSISQAEQCFLTSYFLKLYLFGKYSEKLISSLLNLYECNVCFRNYIQAERMLTIIQQITVKMKNNQLIMGGIHRRRGKLAFLKGRMKQSEQQYRKCNQALNQKYPYCLQFGYLLNNIALLKLQQHKYQQSKDLFEKSSILINFYCCKESSSVKTLKRNLDLVTSYLKQKTD